MRLTEKHGVEINDKLATQIKNYRTNNMSKMPSHTLGVSTFATASTAAAEHCIHKRLACAGATNHTAGVIGATNTTLFPPLATLAPPPPR